MRKAIEAWMAATPEVEIREELERLEHRRRRIEAEMLLLQQALSLSARLRREEEAPSGGTSSHTAPAPGVAGAISLVPFTFTLGSSAAVPMQTLRESVLAVMRTYPGRAWRLQEIHDTLARQGVVPAGRPGNHRLQALLARMDGSGVERPSRGRYRLTGAPVAIHVNGHSDPAAPPLSDTEEAWTSLREEGPFTPEGEPGDAPTWEGP
ncbi:MAG TPA: hypothetical protein VNI34_10125 [Candidatus Nitrosotalea sp.]|nr:hypothetical protein [Candidatus Nitrosotalea sp.]